jgi:predicted nucleic acid-binding protein
MEKMTICIDTNAYSALKRGNKNVLELLENCSVIVIPSIIVGELLAGFNIGSKYHENVAELKVFFNSKVLNSRHQISK